jgi:hypothetical protein
MSNPVKSMSVRSGVRTGNTESDRCYAKRNWSNFEAAFGVHTYYLEKDLKYCLSTAGEPNWYKNFGMSDLAACEITKESVTKNGTLDLLHKHQKLEEMGCDKLVSLYDW